MRVFAWLPWVLVACGSSEPTRPADPVAPPAPAPAPPAPLPAPIVCAPWHYALVGGSFEPTHSVTRAELVAAWQAGTISASKTTHVDLTPALGPHGARALLGPGERPMVDADHWAIIPAHELSPIWSVIAVDGMHALAPPTGPLVGPLVVPHCAPDARPNIDVDRLTTVVMSGTTALTGRTAERIDTHGIADTVRYIQPFFASADLVHISNEVAFVRGCHPRTGQKTLIFCSRDRYVDLLAALHVSLIELTGSHLIDYGRRSLARTIKMYEKRGWRWFGGGRTQIEATEPRIIEHHGNRLAFVGCNAVAWWIRAISPGLGVASCDWPRMRWQIQDLRRRGFLPVATVQHRELKTHTPPPDLVAELRSLAEAGALFVLGSQAHVAHPWDVHYGAYVHYGPGNILFAQYPDQQRDATVDKLYIHDGRLLTVDHLFTRTEHGQPRQLTDDERAVFLGELEAAAGAIAPPSPLAVPASPPLTRNRPDTVVTKTGCNQRLMVTAPAQMTDGVRYPLVVDMTGAAPATDDAFLVVPTGPLYANGGDVAAFMQAKYPVDPQQIRVNETSQSLAPPPRRHRRVSSRR